MAEQKVDPLDLASLPVFVGTMVAEAAILRRRERRDPRDLADAGVETLSGSDPTPDPLVPVGYERRDTTASLSVLAGSAAMMIVTAPLLAKVNRFLYEHRVLDISKRQKAVVFAGAMVFWDFLYYWDHRFQHESRILWANHVAHHSSERYNLSTALRQPWTSFMLAWMFAPMPLLGFEPKTVMRAGQLNLLYQYWIHTEVIDRMSPKFEKVFNTPSHHRAHHGANKQYLDKNYGGILIIWDRMFGTFEPEVRQLKYGLTHNIDTYNPVRIGLQEYVNIARDVKAAKGWRNKLGHVFRGPGWKPAVEPGERPEQLPVKTYEQGYS